MGMANLMRDTVEDAVNQYNRAGAAGAGSGGTGVAENAQLRQSQVSAQPSLAPATGVQDNNTDTSGGGPMVERPLQIENPVPGGNTGGPTDTGGGDTNAQLNGTKRPAVTGSTMPTIDTSPRAPAGSGMAVALASGGNGGTNVTTTTATGSTATGSGGAQATGSGAAAATPAAPVVATTGTANTYNPATMTGSQDVTAGTATAGMANAATAAINPATDTVQGRIGGIIDENSPLMQQAVRRANERSAARGMVNGSIGTQAAESALYDAAMPIATADANAYNAQRMQTQQLETQTSQLNAQLYTDVSKFNVDRALQAGIVNKQQADAIAQFNASSANQASQFNAASAQDMAKFNANQLLQAGIINQDQANKMSMFNAGEANALQRLHEDINARITTANIGASATMGAAQLSAETQRSIASLDAETRTNIANITARNQQLLQGSQSASQLYTQTMNNIAQIQASNTVSDKEGAIGNLVSGLNNGLQLFGQMSGMDLSNILTFPTYTPPEGSSTYRGGTHIQP